MTKEALASPKDAALKLALDTLKRMDGWLVLRNGSGLTSKEKQIVATIEAALAQDEASSSRAAQEPVAWMHTKLDGVVVSHRPADLDRHPDRWKALYKNTPPCSTCEALAPTVMLDQTSHDATPPQRKPLTRGQIREIEVDVALNPSFDYITPAEQLCRAIEAAHGIKE